jgi:hypothetical protein
MAVMKNEARAHTSMGSWFGLVLVLVGLFACFFFALPAALSGNILFASNVIQGNPVQVVLYHDGDTMTFEPGDAEYDQIVNSIYAALGNEIGYYEWGWSEERFSQARSQGISIELMYAQPVKLPGNRLDIADPTRLFVPLDVFGYEGDAVFRGGRSGYWALPIHLESLEDVRVIAREIIAAR